MPRLSVFFIRASLIYLLVGFTLGGLLLANKGVLISPRIWNLLPIHVELLFMGWLAQLAVGVAYWILPRMRGSAPRGNETWSWAAFGLLNTGIVVAVLPALTGLAALLTLGRGLEILGLCAFVWGNWRRVKAAGT